jgi:hypothetical protein
MITDLFASLIFYLLPYLTGRLFTKKIFYAWILGALSWFAIYLGTSAFLQVIGKEASLSLVIKVLAGGITVVSLVRMLRQRKAIAFAPQKLLRKFWPLALLLLLSLFTFFGIWRGTTPYPLQLNWDIYEHITLANKVVEGTFSFFTSQITDTFTFNSYSPIFHVLLSLPKMLFDVNLLGVYWWLEYWHYAVTIIASYLLGYKIFGNRTQAFLMGMLGTLIFISSVAFTPLFLLPQTLCALMLIYAITTLDFRSGKEIGLVVLAMILMHYIIGIVAVGLLLLIYLISKQYLKINKNTIVTLIAVATTIILIAVILLHLQGKWNLTGREEAAFFNFSLQEKGTFLFQWYGIFFPVFFILGYLQILYKGTIGQKFLLSVALMLLACALAPLSYVLKYFVLVWYFVNLILVAGMGMFVNRFSPFGKGIALLLLTFLLLLVFYANQLTFKNYIDFQGKVTHITPLEIEAALWLSANVDKHSFIVSDPTTQYILEAVSGINSQGGAYMSQESRQILSRIAGIDNPEFIKDQVVNIEDGLSFERTRRTRTIFVISGRYFAWQQSTQEEKNTFSFNIWQPRKLDDYGRYLADRLAESGLFKRIYQNDEVAIFSL